MRLQVSMTKKISKYLQTWLSNIEKGSGMINKQELKSIAGKQTNLWRARTEVAYENQTGFQYRNTK